jgi:hypothetical protein
MFKLRQYYWGEIKRNRKRIDYSFPNMSSLQKCPYGTFVKNNTSYHYILQSGDLILTTLSRKVSNPPESWKCSTSPKRKMDEKNWANVSMHNFYVYAMLGCSRGH